jgi:hypothetical protein
VDSFTGKWLVNSFCNYPEEGNDSLKIIAGYTLGSSPSIKPNWKKEMNFKRRGSFRFSRLCAEISHP